jgi:hypothetical protein
MTSSGEETLYQLLARPEPAVSASGETSLTATKETLDADTEDVSDDDIIQG